MDDAIQEANCVISVRAFPEADVTVTAAAIHKVTGVTAGVVADVGKGFRILQK